MTNTDGGNHFKEPGVDDLYKQEWVSMMTYCLLRVERLKGAYDLSRIGIDELIEIARTVGGYYAEYTKTHP